MKNLLRALFYKSVYRFLQIDASKMLAKINIVNFA